MLHARGWSWSSPAAPRQCMTSKSENTRSSNEAVTAIRTLIIDDEALSRERLRSLLGPIDDIQVVGECEGADDALHQIRELRPDLIFLDVQMPGSDGFDVIAEMDIENAPVVVFATAHDEYALRAFEANAIDYLLKPIGGERLLATVNKVRERLRTAPASDDQGLNALLNLLPRTGTYRERFAVKTGNRFSVLRASELLWVAGADNYVELHSTKGMFLHRSTLADMQTILDPRHFLRIHRSLILNVDQVASIEPWGLGEHCFVMSNGASLTSSRRYRNAVREVFGC
jgi:two-component system, LytTR family, response regulator